MSGEHEPTEAPQLPQSARGHEALLRVLTANVGTVVWVEGSREYEIGAAALDNQASNPDSKQPE